MTSFSMQLINSDTSCSLCFIENDTTCKNLFSKKFISWDLLSERNHLKWENTLSLKAVPTKKILLMHQILYCAINYAAPWNEHVDIIFHVNCSEACFVTIEFFYFQVRFLCKWELFFELNKETSFEIDKVRK